LENEKRVLAVGLDPAVGIERHGQDLARQAGHRHAAVIDHTRPDDSVQAVQRWRALPRSRSLHGRGDPV
jgi:hypothetical protein